MGKVTGYSPPRVASAGENQARPTPRREPRDHSRPGRDRKPLGCAALKWNSRLGLLINEILDSVSICPKPKTGCKWSRGPGRASPV